tara:strand:+ start:53 stop:2176 length:2124 start_codon:yes stop_codon:yes gene_type:complete
MKSLLAYLFIVFGLGFFFNTVTNSNSYAAGKWKIGYIDDNGKIFYSSSTTEQFADVNAFHKCQGGGKNRGGQYNTNIVCIKYKIKDPDGTTKDLLKKEVTWQVNVRPLGQQIFKEYNVSKTYSIKKPSDVKKYFSKTIKKALAPCENDKKAMVKKNGSYNNGFGICSVISIIYTETLDPSNNTKLVNIGGINLTDIFVNLNGFEYGEMPSTDTKIAKIEKIEKINKIENKQSSQNKSTIDLSNIYIAKRFGEPGFFIANNKNDSIKRCQNANPTWNNKKCKIVTLPSEAIEMILAQKDSKKGIRIKGVKKKKTLVVKKEKKKKKLIVKKQKKEKEIIVKKKKQEKIIVKKQKQDNEAPVINIAEIITVNDSNYEFNGNVTDKSESIFIEVDGRNIDVINGKFTVKGYSPVNKTITIGAIDQWGNRSKPKIVKLIVDLKNSNIAEKLEPLNPSKIVSDQSDNKVALIIGIENYVDSPDATFANLDAKYFFDYARKGFGVNKNNINLLVDEQATFVKTNKALTKWLRSKVKSGQTELIIFFAGHGLASNDGKELYLLPQDSDPDLLSRTALSRTELFQEIISLNPKNVTIFLDTCYSGVSRDEKTLLASARPVRIVADKQSTPNNFTIFSASQLDQISSGLEEAKHGIFSYYLMKGLEGQADTNKDNNITNGELLAYMDTNISQKASELGRSQNPSLSGDPDKVLMSYR